MKHYDYTGLKYKPVKREDGWFVKTRVQKGVLYGFLFKNTERTEYELLEDVYDKPVVGKEYCHGTVLEVIKPDEDEVWGATMVIVEHTPEQLAVAKANDLNMNHLLEKLERAKRNMYTKADVNNGDASFNGLVHGFSNEIVS